MNTKNTMYPQNALFMEANGEVVSIIQVLKDLGSNMIGKNMELQKTETHIQWRNTGDTEWKDLIAIEELRGEKGEKGDKGDKVLLRANDTHIQYAYESELINKNINFDFNGFGENNRIEKDVTLLDTIKTFAFSNLPEQAKKFKVNTVSILAMNNEGRLSGSSNPSSSAPVESFPALGGLDPKREEIEISNNQKIDINSQIKSICEYGLADIQESIPEASYIHKIILNVTLKGEGFEKTLEIILNVAKEEDANIINGNDELWTNLVSFENLLPMYNELTERITKLEERINSVALEWEETYKLSLE